MGIFREDTAWTPNGTIPIQITASGPLVGPPTNKDQCKGDGWKAFNNPSFKNQGDCVSYVEHHNGKGNDDGHHNAKGNDGGHHNDRGSKR